MQQISGRTPRAGYDLVFATVRAAGPLFRTDEALASAGDLGMSYTAAYQALSGAMRGGIIERLRSGLYLASPPLRSREPHEYLIAMRAVEGAVIAGMSALAFWGLIDQEPVDMVTAVTSRSFTARPQGGAPPGQQEGPTDWLPSGLTIRGIRYVYRRIPSRELVGVALVQVDDATVVPMFDRERMLVDTVIHPRVYGLAMPAFIMSERGEELDMSRVEQYAAQLGATRALRRVHEAAEEVAM